MECISDYHGVLFSDHRIQRIVVEPDVRNEKKFTNLTERPDLHATKKIQLLEKKHI